MILGDESFDAVDEDCLWSAEPMELLGCRAIARPTVAVRSWSLQHMDLIWLDGTVADLQNCAQVPFHSHSLHCLRNALRQQGQWGLVILWRWSGMQWTWYSDTVKGHSKFKHIQTIFSKPGHGKRHSKADSAHQKDKFVEIATKEEEAWWWTWRIDQQFMKEWRSGNYLPPRIIEVEKDTIGKETNLGRPHLHPFTPSIPFHHHWRRVCSK